MFQSSILFFSALVTVLISHLAFIQAVPNYNSPSLFPRDSSTWDPKSTPYPSARRGDTTFSYRSAAANGNVTVADPYNYLEQLASTSKEVQTFDDQQVAFFKTYVKKNFKDLNAIQTSLNDANHYDELQFPNAFGSKENPMYTYYHRELGSDNRVFYVATQADLEQAYRNNFSPLPGKKVFDDASLEKGDYSNYQNLSPDGKTFLYRIRKKGSDDLFKLHLRDISSLKDYSEVISGNADAYDGWTSDSVGFFYMHNDAKFDDGTDTLKYHKLGTSIKDDIIVVKSDSDPNHSKYFEVSNDRKFVIVYIYGDTTKPRIYTASLDQPISSNMKWLSIVPDEELSLNYVTNLENEFYFLASYDNESNQVLKYSVDPTKSRQVNNLKDLSDKAVMEPTVIPEDKTALIDQFTVFDTSKVLLSYAQDAKMNFYIYDLITGKRIQHVLPDFVGSASSLTSLSTGTDIFIWSWTFNCPGEIFHIRWNSDQSSAESDLVYQAKLKAIDPSQFNIELKYAVSKDSTKVPFHLFYKKGTVFDGTKPAMINFFGAFRVVWLPSYKSIFMTWVNDYDAIFILTYPRGGGEVKAEEWHQAGMLDKKQNTIDDINAVIQYLIDNKIAAKGKVFLYGQNAASTIAMAVTNQAPEGNLGLVILKDGMYDLLRFSTTPGSQEYVTEYGDPQKPKDFDWLRKISSLHNVNASKKYPAILFLPDSDPDEQWQARKMVAELQHDLPNNPSPSFFTLPDPTLSDDQNAKDQSVYIIALASHVLNVSRKR